MFECSHNLATQTHYAPAAMLCPSGRNIYEVQAAIYCYLTQTQRLESTKGQSGVL